nr:hypothetical protein [Bdellovibrionales bacterium]
VLLVGFILYTRRHRLIYLLPILGLGLGISTMLTVLWFGSIHAITLAFGPGIAGLAMDYGVHAVFMNPRARETWKSNLAGLVTTLVILFLLLFSAIPLLRQMMFFSILGLTISFALFYFFLSRWPDKFVTKPYDFSPRSWRPGEAVALAMLFAAPLLFLRPVELSLQHMNFESPKTVELRHAFMKISASPSPYWLDLDSLEASEEARVWAAGQKIVFEGAANFLPPVARQERHLQTWRAALCPNENLKLSETQRRFYQPFLASIACGNLRPRPFADPLPNYLSDFRNQDRSIGLLFPTTPEQVAAVRGKYPDSSTPRALFEAFPRVFMNELAWTTPIALLGAFLFLWLHFRRGRLAFLATVPFLTGVGCFAAMAFGFDLPLTFISLIGLLMVFGFSLDYGIFVVTLMGSDGEHKFGVWSALSVCSFSTLAGFVPLVFAGHPVLRDLGHMLLWGSLGTYIGTFWGIPALMRRRA